MVRPCPHRIDCEGSDFPITNYSSEGPETNPLNPCLWFPGTWKEVGGLNLCVSEGGSPEDCFICAKKPKNPDPTKLCNEEQTCTVPCPGGTDVTFTVPAGTFCDNDSELPPPTPTTTTTPPAPPPLPPPPPALGATLRSGIFTENPLHITDPNNPAHNGSTAFIIDCVGMTSPNWYRVRYTLTKAVLKQNTGFGGLMLPATYSTITVESTSKVLENPGSSFQLIFTETGECSITDLTISVTYPPSSLTVERVGNALNYSFGGMVVGISYAGQYEIDLFNNGNWVTMGKIGPAPATASTYSGTDSFFFYSYPSAKVRGGSAWPIDQNGNPI